MADNTNTSPAYFKGGRDVYQGNHVSVSRNNERIDPDGYLAHDPEAEVYISVKGSTSYGFEAISRDEARLVARALENVADQWDEAERKWAEDHKLKSIVDKLNDLPVGTRFVFTEFTDTDDYSFWIKLGEDDYRYVQPDFGYTNSPVGVSYFQIRDAESLVIL